MSSEIRPTREFPLSNPAKDAAVVANLLQEAKFDSVELRQNLSVSDLRRAVSEFFDQATNAEVAIVYYAGHGIEVDGVNYLIPVDAALVRDRDVYDEAISLDRVLQAVESAKKLRLVILDACRDNPFAKSMKKTFSSRAISRGLVGIEPAKPNTLIAFAAKAGSTASDGDGAHSPFTTALLRHLTTPGLDLRKAFGRVRDEVLTATNDSQEPFVYGSLGGADVSLVPSPFDGKAGVDQTTEIRRNYELAERIGTTEAWDTLSRTTATLTTSG
ncbi:caspase domain-containing protein [Bradyrhizobium sp. RDI18]|uniref:caspase family protein n=1 Tax=Bradyrhizobium sp. RDI18 TaxID=3367400 RepID=UPI00371501AB